jgi:CheY-like chemotaxis protein
MSRNGLKTELERVATKAKDMKEIIEWLRTVEELAHRLYSRSSEYFASDTQLSRFLERLAVDEAWHYHLIGSAAEFVSAGKLSVVSSIELDPITTGRVERPLNEAHESLLMGTLSQRQMIESIVQAESSEWNMLFLYAINSLKSFSKLFEYGASVIQSHQDRIEQFLADRPEGLRYVDTIRQLPAVWKSRFLVVEDEQPLRDLLSELLATRGTVETSADGRDALGRTKRHFFDVIVSDISMPNMSGLDFYSEAIKDDPLIGRRFAFCSGEVGFDQQLFIQQNRLPYLRKPFRVNELMETIDRILRESAEVSEKSSEAI